MTTPIDDYVTAATGGRPVARKRGWLGALIQIVVISALAGAYTAVIAISSSHEPETNWASVVTSAAIAAFIAGPIVWGVVTWLRLRLLVAGILLILLGWALWTVLTMSVVVLYNITSGLDIEPALEAVTALVQSNSTLGVIFKLITFVGIWPATWAVVRLLHKQPFGTLFAPEGRIRWGDFALGLMMAAGFWIVTIGIGVAIVGAPVRTDLSMTTWSAALIPLAILVFFQASAEEVLFRGYILQRLAMRWRSPLVWGFLPAFLFGLAHYGNGAPLGVGWHYVIVTLLFGLTAAAMVWRTGSLAAAMGMHTGFNMFSLSVIGLEGVIEGTQLFLYGQERIELLFIADGISTLAILLFVLSPLCPLRPRAAEPAPA